jgi:2-polyprenyl-3-methyl-5-hydroxy-6-metoxy-1,4-benzoquinol methylase
LKDYDIKPGYVARLDNAYFDDTPYTDEYQDAVYAYARATAEARTVADVGCGSGFKLLKYFGHCTTAGVDLRPTVEWLRRTYPKRAWRLFSEPSPKVDFVICADVIEHFVDPDDLLDFIDRYLVATARSNRRWCDRRPAAQRLSRARVERR